MANYDKITEDAVVAFECCLDDEEKGQVRSLVEKCAEHCVQCWNQARDGLPPPNSEDTIQASLTPLETPSEWRR